MSDISPDRRKKNRRSEDATLEEKFEELEDRLRGFFTKALVAFAVIGLASAISLAGFAIVLRSIQEQRYDNIFLNCTGQNERHDRAIKRAQIVLPLESQQAVKLLVDELQPKEPDCAAYARSRVKGDVIHEPQLDHAENR